MPRTPALVAFSVLWFNTGVSGQGTGDADGDGRLTLADSVRIYDHFQYGDPISENTWDGYRDWLCYREDDLFKGHLAGNVYIEALRRACNSPYAHWDDAWGAEGPGPDWEPAPVDDHFRVRLESITAPGGDSDRVEVLLQLHVIKPVRAFSIVLEVENSVLRPSIERVFHWDGWSTNWELPSTIFNQLGPCGDIWCSNTPPTYLISGGKFIIADAPFGRDDGSKQPGIYNLSVEARIGKGTAAGAYSIRLHPASEVVFADKTFGSPFSDKPQAELTVLEDVRTGWDEGLPPLRFDAATRRVLGKVEFRMTDASGRVPEPGKPLFAGLPGDWFRIRVQMRTELPLNEIRYKIKWLDNGLVCGDSNLVNLFQNPEDGQPYEPALGQGESSCVRHALGGSLFRHGVVVGGSDNSIFRNYDNRPLEYFKPLSQWVDLVEVSLRISPVAAGGSVIPLRFAPYHDQADGERLGLIGPFVDFKPYRAAWDCASSLWPGKPYWNYDVIAEDARVEVLGDFPPPPDPALGVRFELGDADASPGEVFEIPVRASNVEDLLVLQLALAHDPAQIELIRFDAWIRGYFTGEPHRVEIPAGRDGMFRECRPSPNGEECSFGIPFAVFNRITEEDGLLVQFLTIPGYPGPDGVEVGRIIARVRDGASAPETRLVAAELTFKQGGIPRPAASGGISESTDVAGNRRFSPAVSVTGGVIRVKGARFRRGDANLDRLIDISDAVFTLGYLFLGQESPGCLDAADADDSGAIEITDPVFLLGAIFLGEGPLPPPYPDCGTDPTADSLTCIESGTCGN